MVVMPDYQDITAYTPNRSTWLFVLIQRYRRNGYTYNEALAMARKYVEINNV